MTPISRSEALASVVLPACPAARSGHRGERLARALLAADRRGPEAVSDLLRKLALRLASIRRAAARESV